MNRFKPGDKARVIGNKYHHHFSIGEVVEIKKVGKSNCGKYDYIAEGEYDFWYVCDSDLEPIEPVQEEESPWISVEDRLPEDMVDLLAYTGVSTLKLYYSDETYYTPDGSIWCDNVTHWMPLPKPPISRLKSEIEELKRNKEAS